MREEAWSGLRWLQASPFPGLDLPYADEVARPYSGVLHRLLRSYDGSLDGDL